MTILKDKLPTWNQNDFVNGISEMRSAAQRLNIMWESMDPVGDLGTQDFPFDLSFDEVVANIIAWERTQQDILKGEK